MRSARGFIIFFASAIAAAWMATGFVLSAKWSEYDGAVMTSRFGMPDSPFLVSAFVWMAIGTFLAIQTLLPIGPSYAQMGRDAAAAFGRMRDTYLGGDDTMDDHDDHHDDMIDDEDEEPMHPSHWTGARLVALMAIAVTFMVCEGLDMVRPAHAHAGHAKAAYAPHP